MKVELKSGWKAEGKLLAFVWLKFLVIGWNRAHTSATAFSEFMQIVTQRHEKSENIPGTAPPAHSLVSRIHENSSASEILSSLPTDSTSTEDLLPLNWLFEAVQPPLPNFMGWLPPRRTIFKIPRSSWHWIKLKFPSSGGFSGKDSIFQWTTFASAAAVVEKDYARRSEY